MKNKYLFLLPIRTILFVIGFYIVSIISNKNINDTSAWWTFIVNVVNIIVIGILIRICKKNNIKFMQLFKQNNKKIKRIEIILVPIFIAILALLGMNISAFLIYKELPYTPECMFQPIPIIWAICNIILLPITTTLAEEGLYLGVGVNNIENKYLSILIPMFFYLLQHSFFPVILDIKFIIFRFISFIFMILFICVYYKRRKYVKPIMIGHFITNFVTAIELLFLSI